MGSDSESSSKVAPVEVEIAKQSLPAQYDWSKHSKKGGCMSLLFQLVLSLTITGSFMFGINIAVLNTSMNTIGAEFMWCGFEGYTGCTDFLFKSAIIQVSVFIGAAIGCMSGGSLLVYGARTIYLVSLGVMAIGIASSAFSSSFASLFIARLIVGLAVGFISVSVPTYIAETTPSSTRGFYGVFHQLFITVGILFGVLLGLALKGPPAAPRGAKVPTPEQMAWKIPAFTRLWWRIMLGIGAIPVFVALFLFLVVYKFETPHYYVKKGQLEDARQLLIRISGNDDVEKELNEIVDQCEQSEKAKRSGLSFLSAMKDWKYGKIILIGIVVSSFQQLSGINAFVTNSNKLFADAGLSSNLVTIFSIILTATNVVMTFPPIYLIDVVGRRLLLLIGVAGMFIGVLPGSLMLWINEKSQITSWIAIVGAIIFIVFFAATYGPVLWVYLFECYPIEIKDSASGAAVAANWVTGIMIVFAGSYLSTKLAYTIFSCLNIVGFVFLLLVCRETKGRVVGDSPYLD